MPDLTRFLSAQADTYATALGELQRGRKRLHWMWFIFPQLRGLGVSETAQFYGIADRAEALAYGAHPVLSARLRDCTRALLAHAGTLTAHDILGSPDDLKLRSCLTLFATVQSKEPLWVDALAAFYEGVPDRRTLELLPNCEAASNKTSQL